MQTRIRLYHPSSLSKGLTDQLPTPAAHYLLTVMRLKAGDYFRIFNGQDGEWLAEISAQHKQKCQYTVVDQLRASASETGIKLLFAPIKPHRQVFLIEKATELGARCLQPVYMHHSAIRHFNAEKAYAQMVEAVEQSERLTVPILEPALSLPQLLAAWPENETLVVADERRTAPSLSSNLPHINKEHTSLLIGPEGGFSSAEFEMLEAHKAVKMVSLGPTVLRTETAALAAISLFHCR